MSLRITKTTTSWWWKELPMTDQRKDAFETAYIELGGIGKRVLRFCDFILPKAKHPTGNPFEPDEKNSPRRSPICWTYVYHRSSLSCCTRWCCHLSICWYQGDHVTGDHPITAKASEKVLKSSLGENKPFLTLVDTKQRFLAWWWSSCPNRGNDFTRSNRYTSWSSWQSWWWSWRNLRLRLHPFASGHSFFKLWPKREFII